MCHLATPCCDLDQHSWICRLIPFVEGQWLSSRMPDSRSREHRHESSTHIWAVDDDSLWRCYATTKYNHCTIVLVLCNKLWFILFIYNTVSPLKLLNDFHRKLIYLWYMTPHLVLLELSYRWKIWVHLLKRIQISNAISLPLQKWKCGFLTLFFSKKLTYVHEMFPLLRTHHSRLLYQSGQDSRDAAWDHRCVLEDSSLVKCKSKGRFYIAQSFTLFALPFYSNTNSASPGSTPTMQHLRVTTKSLTFLSLSISCCRNRCRNSVTGMPYSVHGPNNGKRCLLCWCHTFQCNNMKMSYLTSCVQYGM